MYKKLPLKRHWKISNTDIYIFETENILNLEAEKNDVIVRYDSNLSKISSVKKRNEFIATRIIHHHILNHTEPICYKDSAPHFCDTYSISVSHSANHIAIAYSKTHRIGIDLEKANDRIERIAYKILHPEEMLYKSSLSEEDKYIYLNRIWTTKEACYKACKTNLYSFKEYKSENILNENPVCRISKTKESFKLYFKQLEKFYFCLAILS